MILNKIFLHEREQSLYCRYGVYARDIIFLHEGAQSLHCRCGDYAGKKFPSRMRLSCTMARSPSTVVTESTLGTSFSFTNARSPFTVVTGSTLGTSISCTNARSPSTVVAATTLGTEWRAVRHRRTTLGRKFFFYYAHTQSHSNSCSWGAQALTLFLPVVFHPQLLHPLIFHVLIKSSESINNAAGG